MRKVEIKEVIEIFVEFTLPSLKIENETPNFNIIMPEEGFEIIEYVKKHPFKLKDSWTPNITDECIEYLKIENNSDENNPTMIIKDVKLFFKYLTDIINTLGELQEKYNKSTNPRRNIMNVLSRIWLRMGLTDFEDVSSFLRKQLRFVQNIELDDLKEPKIMSEFMGFTVIAETHLNHTWDETNRSIHFTLKEENETHDLSKIHYEICEEDNEKVCYIYAVQNKENGKKSSKIQRKLYKLNKGLSKEECNVHPNQIAPLIIFVRLLNERGIYNIKIPTIQVLNYRYHELLSDREKERFKNNWPEDRIKQLYEENESDSINIREYEYELSWYNRVVDKADQISKLKTEKFYHLIERLNKYYNLTQINDLDIQNGTINLILKQKY